MKKVKKNLFNRGLIMRKSINVMLVASVFVAMITVPNEVEEQDNMNKEAKDE